MPNMNPGRDLHCPRCPNRLRYVTTRNADGSYAKLGMMPPEAVHYGRAEALTVQRALTLEAAFSAHPLRFKRKTPKPPALPTAAWINPPPPHRRTRESGEENRSLSQFTGVPDPRGTPQSPLLQLPMRSLCVTSPEKCSPHPLPTENPKHHATCSLIS